MMFGFKASPITNIFNQKTIDPGIPGCSGSNNPFDLDAESDKKQTLKPAKRTSSEPNLLIPQKLNYNNPFDNVDDNEISSYARNNYNNGFRESGGLQSQSMEEMENYALTKAEETTKTVNGCLKIAEDIREDASNTLIILHQQGEQIARTHITAANMDNDLSRGEKLLGTLGGMFSRTWKPKKTRPINGPMITGDGTTKTMGYDKEQRRKFGLSNASKPRSASADATPPPESTETLMKVEAEKVKQDDALSDLSNILGDLKSMAVDMGSEIENQNKSLDHLQDDVEELNFRVKGANQRARRLVGK